MHECENRCSRVALAPLPALSFPTVGMGNCWGKADEEDGNPLNLPQPPKSSARNVLGYTQHLGYATVGVRPWDSLIAIANLILSCLINYCTVVVALSKDAYSAGELVPLVSPSSKHSQGSMLTSTCARTLQGQLCGCCTLLFSPSDTLETQRQASGGLLHMS